MADKKTNNLGFERLLHERQERLKELACINQTNQIIREGKSLEETLHQICLLLPRAWQYPDFTVALSHTHYLGEDFDGGIIFYIYIGSDGQQHGLIVSKTEATSTKWQNTATTTNANRSWDGTYNTPLMTDSPAKNWATGLGAGWYLPSIDELSILWHARLHVNKAMNDGGHTLLATTGYYWSSTEYSSTNAWFFDFYYGHAFNYGKANTFSVRAVRAF